MRPAEDSEIDQNPPGTGMKTLNLYPEHPARHCRKEIWDRDPGCQHAAIPCILVGTSSPHMKWCPSVSQNLELSDIIFYLWVDVVLQRQSQAPMWPLDSTCRASWQKQQKKVKLHAARCPFRRPVVRILPDDWFAIRAWVNARSTALRASVREDASSRLRTASFFPFLFCCFALLLLSVLYRRSPALNEQSWS